MTSDITSTPSHASYHDYMRTKFRSTGMSNSINTHDTDNNASSENSNMGNNGHNYLSNAPYSQDQYSVVNGQYGESNNFSGWNSGVTSRGSPQASMEHPQVNRLDRNSVGGFSQNQNQNHGMNMHSQQDWQGHSMQRGISSDAQMPFLQQQQHLINYNNNNDFNSLNGGENMMGMGIGMGMGMNHSMNRSNNRFASSQMSQMGQNQSGGRNFISSLSGTGGSNAQGRALNKMLLEILRSAFLSPPFHSLPFLLLSFPCFYFPSPISPFPAFPFPILICIHAVPFPSTTTYRSLHVRKNNSICRIM